MSEIDWSQVGRAMAARRKRTERQCPECGASFQSLSWQRYCSRACLNRATVRRYRERQRASPSSDANKVEPAPAMVTTASSSTAESPELPPLAVGARVELRQPLPDIPSEALGRIVQIAGSQAVVQFDRYARERRVPLAQLQPAPSPPPMGRARNREGWGPHYPRRSR